RRRRPRPPPDRHPPGTRRPARGHRRGRVLPRLTRGPAHHHARTVRRRRRLPALTTPPPTDHETTGPSGPHPGVPEQERPTMPRQRVATPAATATELVNAYRPRDFLLTSASGSLLGRGVLATATGVEDLSGVLGEVATDT